MTKGKITAIIILIAAIAAGGIAAYKLIAINDEYSVGVKEYDGLKQYAIKTDDGKDEKETPGKDEKKETEEEVRVPVDVDIESLKAINPDFAAWLYVGGEDISYPVVHAEDNSKYLHLTFEGTYNFAGTLFIEFLNNPNLKDPNTIIYGHCMKNRTMFGSLRFLWEQENYLKDDTFWLINEDGAFRYKIFNMTITDAASDVYSYFTSPCEEVVKYIKEMNSLSLVPLDIPEGINENSKIVTLSTCYGVDSPQRFVVQGIMINDDGTARTDIESNTKKEEPKDDEDEDCGSVTIIEPVQN